VPSEGEGHFFHKEVVIFSYIKTKESPESSIIFLELITLTNGFFIIK